MNDHVSSKPAMNLVQSLQLQLQSQHSDYTCLLCVLVVYCLVLGGKWPTKPSVGAEVTSRGQPHPQKTTTPILVV